MSSKKADSDNRTDTDFYKDLKELELEIVFNLDVKKAYSAFFEDENGIYRKAQVQKGFKDIEVETVSPKEKKLTYIVPVKSNFVKKKETNCIEYMTSDISEDNQNYMVESIVKTPDVLYGDSFNIVTRYIFREDDNGAFLKVTKQVEWKSKPLVSKIIKASIDKSFKEFIMVIKSLLNEKGLIQEEENIPTFEEEDTRSNGMLWKIPCGIFITWIIMVILKWITKKEDGFVEEIIENVNKYNTWNNNKYKKAYLKLEKKKGKIHMIEKKLEEILRRCKETDERIQIVQSNVIRMDI
eukprot:GHVP01043210.1.p1 GENE.GHVP01043210.1~~GHVP01043210.1.p1  ORF type:complete len:296 (+),score=58.35 GHVP01043210.1:715-1602(+)